METLYNFTFFFVSLGLAEAVVKPLAKKFMQRKILKVAPPLLNAIDKALPKLLETNDPAELEDKVREIAERLTGEDWSDTNLDLVFQMFDLRVAVSKKNRQCDRV